MPEGAAPWRTLIDLIADVTREHVDFVASRAHEDEKHDGARRWCGRGTCGVLDVRGYDLWVKAGWDEDDDPELYEILFDEYPPLPHAAVLPGGHTPHWMSTLRDVVGSLLDDAAYLAHESEQHPEVRMFCTQGACSLDPWETADAIYRLWQESFIMKRNPVVPLASPVTGRTKIVMVP